MVWLRNGFGSCACRFVMWRVRNCTCSVSDVSGWGAGGKVNGERADGMVAMVGTCVGRRGVEKHTRLTVGKGDPARRHATLNYRRKQARRLETADVYGT